MLTIENMTALSQHLLQQIDSDKDHIFLNPLPTPQIQRGECCKLYAMHTVMNWLYQTDNTHPSPPPIRQSDVSINNRQQTLRSQAKHFFHSQVGEIYQSTDMVKLAQHNGYDESNLITADDNYIESIILQLQQGHAPIIFFDIDFNTKGPTLLQSKQEHAGVICGYYYDKDNNPWFIATYWNNYYFIQADQLKKSAAQLALFRKPETFYKIDDQWYSDHGRHLIDQTKTQQIRSGKAPQKFTATFRNKLLIIAAKNTAQSRKEFVCTIDQFAIAAFNRPAKKLRIAIPPTPMAIEQSSYSLQTHQEAKKFIALTKAITFFTLDILRPSAERFKQTDFQQFFQSENLEKEMDVLLQQFHPAVDQSLEGDIYNQNQQRARSIVEEVSNSIDAHPEAIDCSIRDGYYEIREINGQGMSAEIICTKYLLPKATTKINSENQIGRFGIGSFTKLAHLNSAEASIIVETRALDDIGYRLEYRLIDGCICIAMEADESITHYGTLTKVTSSEIIARNYEEILLENLGDNITTPITINESIYVSHKMQRSASICINNIRIQKVIHPVDSFTMQVSWNFSHNTTISEGRNKIILDNANTFRELREHIGKIRAMSYPDWAMYANTIAPLVAEIQATNHSLLATDNIFDYLLEIVQQKLGLQKCVPDLPLYKPMLHADVIPLHPVITPADWIKRTATLSQEWQGKDTLFLADLAYYPDDMPFIHDKENNQIIIDSTFYKKIKLNGNLELLNLIFKYPPGEINITFCGQYKSDEKEVKQTEVIDRETKTAKPLELTPTANEEKPQEALEKPREAQVVAQSLPTVQKNKKLTQPEVTFNATLMENPLHSLYQRHGILWLYGDNATQQILATLPNAATILAEAKSLVAIYQSPAYIKHLKTNSTYNIDGPLLSVIFQEKQYYCFVGDNHQYFLFNEYFQRLSHAKWEPLKAKIIQHFKTHRLNECVFYHLELQIQLDENDVLAVYNPVSEMYSLCDGKGRVIDPEYTCQSLIVRSLNDDYYLINKISGGRHKGFLYHRHQGKIAVVPDILLSWKMLQDNVTLAGIDYTDGVIKYLFDIPSGKIIQSEYQTFLYTEKFLLGINKIYERLALMTLSGELIYTFPPNKWFKNILYFHCEQINADQFNFSVLDMYGAVHFFKIDKQGALQYFDSTKTIGFPVNATIQHDGQNNCSITPTDLTQPRFVDLQISNVFDNKTIDSQLIWYDDKKKSLNQIYKELPALIFKQNGQLTALNPHTLAVTPLNIDWNMEDISSVLVENNYFYIHHIKDTQNQSLTAIVHQTGRLMGIGYRIYLRESSQGDFLFHDGSVYTPNGRLINSTKAKDFKLLETAHGPLIVIYFEKEESRVYDITGNPVHANEKICCFSEQLHKGYYSLSSQGALYTPYGKIEKGQMRYSEFHHDKVKADNLIQVRDKNHIFLLTQAGYPFFPEALPEHVTMLRRHIFYIASAVSKHIKTVLSPLPLRHLTDPIVLQNLAYLNQLNLDVFIYAEALRFINWPLNILQKIIPYLSILTFTPDLKYAAEYQIILEFAEKLDVRNRDLILKIFNLSYLTMHEKLAEPIAQKLINVVEIHGVSTLEDCYKNLNTHQYDLALSLDFVTDKAIIDEMSNMAGQILYYLFYPAKQLLASSQMSIFSQLPKINTFYLLNFMAAFQFDDSILDRLIDDPLQLLAEIKKWGDYADKSHLVRLLQHAIYHQADPNKHLYERELLQNALDAYAAMPLQGKDAIISAYLMQEDQHCVFRLQNQATGMSLQEVFYFYALLGTSSKRTDRHAHFIGGHGVGAFTVYHNAKLVRLKTGNNDGNIYCFEFRPIYADNNKIIDIEVTWEKQMGHFQGVIVERVAQSEMPTLDAARHHRTFKMHAKTVNAAVVTITLNDQQLNKTIKPLAAIAMPELGNVTLYRSVEDMLTVAGLSMRPIDNLDYFIPEKIRTILRKNGLIIDFPKKIPLNRERTEFIDADYVYEFLRPYLFQAYIEAYVRSFMQDHLALSELPYDFFEHFEKYTANMVQLNPELLQDAQNIIQNRPLPHYEKYASLAKLHELMAYLPIFKVQQDDTTQMNLNVDQQKSYSLIELAQYYRQFRRFPQLQQIPPRLNQFASYYDASCLEKTRQKKCAKELEKFPEITWKTFDYPSTPDWRALCEISIYIAKCMGYAMEFGFSTITNGALLHTNLRSTNIYWNVYAASDGLGKELLQSLNDKKSNALSNYLLNELLDKISHEIVHAKLQEPCGSTHNRSFSLKQRKLLITITEAFRAEVLTQEIQKIYADCMGTHKKIKNLLDWKVFLKAQFPNNKNATDLFRLFPQLSLEDFWKKMDAAENLSDKRGFVK